jgi:hypothetical protein
MPSDVGRRACSGSCRDTPKEHLVGETVPRHGAGVRRIPHQQANLDPNACSPPRRSLGAESATAASDEPRPDPSPPDPEPIKLRGWPEHPLTMSRFLEQPCDQDSPAPAAIRPTRTMRLLRRRPNRAATATPGGIDTARSRGLAQAANQCDVASDGAGATTLFV